MVFLQCELSFSYTGGKGYDKKPIFLKRLIYAYWTKNITVLTIGVSTLCAAFTISLDFKNMYIFFKTFFVRTFYHAICNIFNTRD